MDWQKRSTCHDYHTSWASQWSRQMMRHIMRRRPSVWSSLHKREAGRTEGGGKAKSEITPCWRTALHAVVVVVLWPYLPPDVAQTAEEDVHHHHTAASWWVSWFINAAKNSWAQCTNRVVRVGAVGSVFWVMSNQSTMDYCITIFESKTFTRVLFMYFCFIFQYNKITEDNIKKYIKFVYTYS